jgi:DNA-binding phage protein
MGRSRQTAADVAAELRHHIANAEKRGMTRSSIADAAEMPRSQLTRIATGESIPRLDTAERVAKVLGLRITLVAIAKMQFTR